MPKLEKDLQCCFTDCENPTNQSYWDSKWKSNQTGWDVGKATPAITKYIEQYGNKNSAILIPGCGNAYEAEFLVASGFTNINLIDIAPNAVDKLKEKFAYKPQVRLFCGDFFEHEGSYDLIIEQTFFCAIPPVRRKDYAQKMASLLNENGKIIGLLFDKTFENQGPPFGGSLSEYKVIFEPYFTIKTMDKCYNSILPRANSEVFINLIKK